MSVYDIVRKAIRNKEIIVATYDGFVREMCPHPTRHRNQERSRAGVVLTGRRRKQEEVGP